MQRFWEIILGLDRGFLGREGEFSLQFNPDWPFQRVVGASTWNIVLGALCLAIVIWVYRREGRGRFARILLGCVRLMLLGFVLVMLNRPAITLSQNRSEPSVLAVAIDDSLSMGVRDVAAGGTSVSRLEAALDLLAGENQSLLRQLARKHILKFYRFNREARQLAVLAPAGTGTPPATAPAELDVRFLHDLRPEGRSTQVLSSLRQIMEELQGQRVAGIVLLTDGRSSPAESLSDRLAAVREFAMRVYPVSVGSDRPPRNLAIEAVAMEEAAFAEDLVSARVSVRASGFSAGDRAVVVLKERNSGQPLLRADGKPAEETVILPGDGLHDVELNFKPPREGTLDIVAEVSRQPGEIDEEDNTFPRQIEILSTKIVVLYCEGYPRWDYRYLKDELIRDKKSFEVSCLLFSADAGFAQEGTRPITRFPESMSELLDYDVVLFGDVDSRQFTDAQLQLVADFVLRKNGGFGMVAGPKYAPYSYRNTPIEPVLPVNISRTQPEESINIPLGFRPVLTRAGQQSMIFRFLPDKSANEKFLKEDWQPLFWYCRGITVKRDVGEVYAEHPTDTAPDGRKAPLLVLGRYGGRTLFSAIDDSWRWRFYTGEHIFRNYWVQQLRYLAREKKLGQRRLTITALKPSYELGQQVEVHMRVLDPDLLAQLPDQITVVIAHRSKNGAPALPDRQETLEKRPGQPDLYVASWTADKAGQFSLRLPALGGNVDATEVPIVVKVPRAELSQVQVDRDLLSKLAFRESSTADGSSPDVDRLRLDGQTSPAEVRAELLKIPSAAMVVPVYTNGLLWDAPLAMIVFVLLITAEWVLRKAYGML